MNDATKESDKPDLDTQIREAEMTVVESDRRWRRHIQALGPALRASTGNAAFVGGVGLGALALTWLIVRLLTRGRRTRTPAEPRRAPRHRVTAPMDRPSVQPGHQPILRPTGWRRFTELGGALVGSALRTGLAPAEGKAAMPLLLSAGLPWLTRWWRARTRTQDREQARKQAPPFAHPPGPPADSRSASGFTRQAPRPATARSDRSVPLA